MCQLLVLVILTVNNLALGVICVNVGQYTISVSVTISGKCSKSHQLASGKKIKIQNKYTFKQYIAIGHILDKAFRHYFSILATWKSSSIWISPFTTHSGLMFLSVVSCNL